MKTCSKCGETKPATEFHKHAETRDRLRPDCKVCRKARAAAYHAANPEKAKASNAKYYAANREKVLATNAQWAADNPDKVKAIKDKWADDNQEKVKASHAKWRAANPGKHNANSVKWRAENPEIKKAINSRWWAANPESRRIYSQNYQSSKRANGGTLSKGLAAKLFKLQKGKCACCGEPLGTGYHLDHIMPIKLGGTNTDNNIQLLRSTCNHKKSARHPIDFMQSKGLLL